MIAFSYGRLPMDAEDPSRSVLADSALARVAGVTVLLAGLWLAVAWAVSVP